ncbi:unnamed protein product [Pleuronectes platessa]|uniref:Uncharacterized protein n=1 Tax=Pleuronectes platessa TaxID=8262 RepID=A0A9N7UVQ4_PLEPL|nr:unnamed protein product [Pleuronectes platessa]
MATVLNVRRSCEHVRVEGVATERDRSVGKRCTICSTSGISDLLRPAPVCSCFLLMSMEKNSNYKWMKRSHLPAAMCESRKPKPTDNIRTGHM